MTGTQFCHMCGEKLEAGDKFCASCGVKTGAEFCRMCGHHLEAGDKFCPICGARVILIEKVTTLDVQPLEVRPKEAEPEYDYVDMEGEITALAGEQPLFPTRRIKIKFQKGNIQTWILDPIAGILLWTISAILIFLILDDGWSAIQYARQLVDWTEAGEFAWWWFDPNRPEHLFDWPSVFWFVGIGVFMLAIGWLWSLVSFIRGPPKVDLIASNQRLIVRDDSRTGFLTRAMLGVNIFLVVRNPFHIKKVRNTYKGLKHQLETTRDEMEHDYLILTKKDCIQKIEMKKVTFFFQSLVFIVLTYITVILYPALSLVFLLLFILSLLLSVFRLIFKRKHPRVTFRASTCQGQLRHFVESTNIDMIGLSKDEETQIMTTFRH